MKRLIQVSLMMGVFGLAIFAVPAIALAHDGENHTTAREAQQHEAAAKLDDTKKRACQARAQNITALMTRSLFRAENHSKLLATITERVKTFAKNHPLGPDKDGRPSDYYQHTST
ncbi:MAG TPA: hypothetical protein VFT87_03230 [Candidatus Saccharimonadales bacterium]|nr:hypothetical protein [Candidatus Saccharimonadales bacterium]